MGWRTDLHLISKKSVLQGRTWAVIRQYQSKENKRNWPNKALLRNCFNHQVREAQSVAYRCAERSTVPSPARRRGRHRGERRGTIAGDPAAWAKVIADRGRSRQ